MYDSTYDMDIFYDGETGVMMNYSMHVFQLKRADGVTTKNYYIKSVLTSINGYDTGLSLLPTGPSDEGISTEQIIFYVIIGGFIILVGAVVVGIYRAPNDIQGK